MHEHFPSLILNYKDIKENKRSYAVVVLNRPISLDKELVVSLWNHCKFNFNFKFKAFNFLF